MIDEDGTYALIDFEDGKKEGKCICFYENGKIKYECFYSDDVLHGEYIHYNYGYLFDSIDKKYYEHGKLIKKWFQLFKL